MSMNRRATWWRVVAILTALLLIPQSLVGAARPENLIPPGPDNPVRLPHLGFPQLDEEAEERLLELDFAIESERLAGDNRLTAAQASRMREAAEKASKESKKHKAPAPGPRTFDTSWLSIGPDPIGEFTRSGPGALVSMQGRIGALAIRPSTGEWILGGAQGGIWVFDGANWVPKTDTLGSLAIGALAIAPSDDSIIYAGTGEGALSGDSYFGNGILKSTDGGQNWSHVSGDYFVSVSISRLVVDPNDADHLFVSVLRGRGGARRVSPPIHSRFGIWESKDGGAKWKLLEEAPPDTNGATDLEMDPQNPEIMYASFWGDQVYKSTDGGHDWDPIMDGLPTNMNFENLTRFSIGLSHPDGEDAVLYVGTDFIDDAGDYQQSRLWRSDDEGDSWDELPVTGFGDNPEDSVLDYCGGQCFYDNVIEVDPTNTDIVYAGGQFAYDIGSGGQFRSDDGGQTWKNLGWDLHPDYHAFAFNPADPDQVLTGSDGGVWFSEDRGGRLPGSDGEAELASVDWLSLNCCGLSLGQFTSIATNPSFPASAGPPASPARERMWGGTQDNGTMRKSAVSNTWFDMYSGDGGQVLVDPTDWHYVYGTYFGVSPYRDTAGGGIFFNNQFITGGIDLNDRSDFYIPWVLNKENPNQLLLGTYRVYRTDNAKATSAGDVHWTAISPDLTRGCEGTAPNGARTCALSAIGIGGGNAVYTGSLDGLVYLSTDAKVNGNSTWTRLDKKGKVLPNRPIAQIAVDRSNYRIAYFAYNGFNAATPKRPGHVFRTTDGGNKFVNISGNLPDVPVNSIILDPSYPNTLYVGTDVGPFVTYDGGANWGALGAGFPIVGIWQMDLDPGAPAGVNPAGPRRLLAGTHGRGAFRIQESRAVPALMVSKVDAGVPVGPASNVTYTLTIRNIGNAAATGVTIKDPIPDHTSFVSAADGGTFANDTVTWSGKTIAAGASIAVHFTVSIAPALKKKVKSIVNDGITVTSAQGVGTTGSPTITPIAPRYAVSILPASQTDGARAGESVNYTLTVKNLGFTPDSYAVSSSGGTFPTSIFAADCTTPLATTASVAPGGTTNVCVQVTVPDGTANAATSTSTITATSVGNPSVSASATVTTIAVTLDTLLVDNDGNIPDVQSFYTAALTSAGVAFNTWDLAANPNIPLGYMKAHTTIVWFTGNSYPSPITPYEARLASFLDGGGNLFMNGQDILDQAAGTTPFVHDYLHITWDGTETQNDKGTAFVHGIAGSPISDGIGAVALNHAVLLGAFFEDRITPNGGALPAFVDDGNPAATPPLPPQTDALSFAGSYKVVFLAFPLEAYGTAPDKVDLVNRVMDFFAGP
jgi:uncharacterized repeat protein (TIGR01451 family)